MLIVTVILLSMIDEANQFPGARNMFELFYGNKV